MYRAHRAEYETLRDIDKIQHRSPAAAALQPSTVLLDMDKNKWENFIIGMVVEHGTPLTTFRYSN